MQSIRSRLILGACAIALPFALACDRRDDAPPPEPAPPAAEVDAGAVRAEVEARVDAYVSAWNGSDPAAMQDYFAEDATATVNEETYSGRAEIMAGWVTPNVGAISDLDATETAGEMRGDDYWSEGTYSHTVEGVDGTITGRYSVTWTRGPDGVWRIRSTEVQQDQPAQT